MVDQKQNDIHMRYENTSSIMEAPYSHLDQTNSNSAYP